jgi:hypothetical protein
MRAAPHTPRDEGRQPHAHPAPLGAPAHGRLRSRVASLAGGARALQGLLGVTALPGLLGAFPPACRCRRCKAQCRGLPCGSSSSSTGRSRTGTRGAAPCRHCGAQARIPSPRSAPRPVCARRRLCSTLLDTGHLCSMPCSVQILLGTDTVPGASVPWSSVPSAQTPCSAQVPQAKDLPFYGNLLKLVVCVLGADA